MEQKSINYLRPLVIEWVDIIIKSLALILAIIGFIAGTKTIKKQNEAKFWDKQLTVYSELLKTTSVMSHTKIDSKEYKEAKSKFLELYYGEAHLVSSEKVNNNIAEFKNTIERFEIESDLEQRGVIKSELKRLSLRLSKECRTSSLRSRSIDLVK